MSRIITYLFGITAFTVISIAIRENASWFAITSGIAVGFAVPLVDAAIANARWLRLATYGMRTWRKQVRISAAYLYRIKVDNEYLLIKGARFNQYQPVGGVYKAHASFTYMRNRLNILDDDLLKPDEVSESDLRIRIPGKNLYRFAQWFDSDRNRETDCWREFHEELIDTEILPEATFRYVKYDRIRRRYSKLHYSEWAQSHELLISDIVELIPSSEQLEALKCLKKSDDDRIMWAPEAQIRRLGANAGNSAQSTRIAQTALWTIDSGK